MKSSPVLKGFYKLLFLYLEPISTFLPAIMIYGAPGAHWFHHELIPDGSPVPPPGFLDPRSTMAVWQLANCYLLLGMLEGLGLRAVLKALPDNLVAQERLVGATLLAMAIADITHILATWFALPSDLQYNFAAWNGTTHGNITAVVFLFIARVSWFQGVGRKRYWYGQKKSSGKVKST
ncbi:hypothetical protein NLI96_g12312 [Meripilus lineatus]|uniref:DUF7704 domain-containing protein n=1 Tax=Meripilus lineatus TaxID=2056292 RepID=A0AAD5YCI5_9APHY|nr:hypothetical protein NLI96_g12312 [Physisporinus lineatus]